MSQQTSAASALPTLRQEPDLSKLEAGAGEGNTIPRNGEAAAAAAGGGGRRGGEQEMYHLAEGDGGEEEGGSHWSSAGRRASLEKYRWAELIVLVIIICLAYKGSHQGVKKDWMFIPQVTQLLPDGTAVVLGNATAFSYPIKFQGGELECAPITLQNCGVNAELAATEPCCAFMKTGAGPHQTISVQMLAGLCVVFPLLLFLLRHALLQKYLYSSSSSSNSSSSSRRKNSLSPSSPSSLPFSATHSLRDVLLGFLFSIALTQATTNSLKTFVSQPRPNHFALLLFASLSPPSYQTIHYQHSAWASWPSGHCSMSMTTGAYLSLVLLRDIKQSAGTTQRELRTILVLLAMGPVFLALYIAGTRVHDYFHSAADAVTGMGLGLVWALVSFYHILPANGLEVRPNKPLKYL